MIDTRLIKYRGYYYQQFDDNRYVVLDDELNNKGDRKSIEECKAFIDELITLRQDEYKKHKR